MLESFIEGLRSLWHWLPIIWRDRDWDWHFLLAILRHKLRRSSRYFDSDETMAEDGPAISRQMQLCIRLADRIIAESYWKIADGRYAHRFGPVPKSEVIGNRFHTEWPSEEARQYWLQCRMDADDMHQLDCNRLFGIVAKYLRGWWD